MSEEKAPEFSRTIMQMEVSPELIGIKLRYRERQRAAFEMMRNVSHMQMAQMQGVAHAGCTYCGSVLNELLLGIDPPRIL
jgi:hypothetical protein